MAKRKYKRPLAPEPVIEQDLNKVWVYFTRHTLLYPIPWATAWPSIEAINQLKKLLTNGSEKIIFAKKRR